MVKRLAIASAAIALVLIVVVTVFVARYFAPGVRGSGAVKTETFALEAFDQVSLEGVGTARIAIGEPQRLQITTDDNLFALLDVGVEEGTLTIRSVQEIRPSELLVTIGVPDLRGVALVGNPKVEVPNIVRESFGITITGHGTAEVSGETDHLTVKIMGNGLVRSAGLLARRVDVRIAGAGDVQVHATEALSVTSFGSGSVRYSGTPKITHAGDASVQRIE